MQNKDARNPAIVQDIATISLVAIVTCGLATDAWASHPPAVRGADLSARVAAISARINASEAAWARDLPRQRSIAWNNK